MAAPKFSRLTPGARLVVERGGDWGPQQGRVLTVTPAGATFELPTTPGYSWGPAPWPIGAADDAEDALAGGTAPQPGDVCLVVFAGDAHAPWLLAWWR